MYRTRADEARAGEGSHLADHPLCQGDPGPEGDCRESTLGVHSGTFITGQRAITIYINNKLVCREGVRYWSPLDTQSTQALLFSIPGTSSVVVLFAECKEENFQTFRS